MRHFRLPALRYELRWDFVLNSVTCVSEVVVLAVLGKDKVDGIEPSFTCYTRWNQHAVTWPVLPWELN